MLWGYSLNVPGLQLAVLRRAVKYTSDSIDLATALNISAFNLGIAGGSFIGGVIYSNFSPTIFGFLAAGIAYITCLLITSTQSKVE